MIPMKMTSFEKHRWKQYLRMVVIFELLVAGFLYLIFKYGVSHTSLHGIDMEDLRDKLILTMYGFIMLICIPLSKAIAHNDSMIPHCAGDVPPFAPSVEDADRKLRHLRLYGWKVGEE